MRRPLRSRRRGLGVRVALLLGVWAGAAGAQPPPSPPLVPGAPPVRVARCGPGSTDPRCQARRVTVAPAGSARGAFDPGPALPPDDVRGTRFVPPAIRLFLADRRIAPTTRAVLGHLAGKPTEEWTLGELQEVTQLVPTLTELAIPTRVLSDFYQFLGLDPTELFEPRLGQFNTGTGFDRRNYDAVQQAQCLYLLGYGESIDPSRVLLKDLAACSDSP